MDYKQEYEFGEITMKAEAKKDAFLRKECWDKEEFEFYTMKSRVMALLPSSLTPEDIDRLCVVYEKALEEESWNLLNK